MALFLKKCFLTLIIILWACHSALAFGINLTNFGPSGNDTANDTMEFTFDVAYEYPWNNETNFNCLWIFMKVEESPDASPAFEHTYLEASGINPTGTTAPEGFDIIVPEDKVGFFLQPKSGQTTSGDSYTLTDIKFTWDYGNSNIDTTSSRLGFKLFAIEMVYIPEGSFIAGDASATTTSTPSAVGASESFRYLARFSTTGSTFNVISGWPINSEDALVIRNTAYLPIATAVRYSQIEPFYFYEDGGATGEISDEIFTLPASFPKGYKAFYMMRNEISQAQYRDFLNSIGWTHASLRCQATAPSLFCDSASSTGPIDRQNLMLVTSGSNYEYGANADTLLMAVNTSDDGEWVAMNYLGWKDLTAYLDWAGLRPMTELEFEKAARGPETPLEGEYAWGTSVMIAAATTMTALNSVSEAPNAGNAAYAAVAASCTGCLPMRVGCFAKSATARQNAGGGYYGNLDLSGNLEETLISVGNENGHNFVGTHGDGILDASKGIATNQDWPDELKSGGIGFRGGTYADTLAPLHLSDRRNCPAETSGARERDAEKGGRGVRTAPNFQPTGNP